MTKVKAELKAILAAREGIERSRAQNLAIKQLQNNQDLFVNIAMQQ